ncbi:MAG: hypothetical protein NTZ35_20620 [Ignavibacteriales bacterium]|nr:hypothetical protein [Ignavibacteriales bacterium]
MGLFRKHAFFASYGRGIVAAGGVGGEFVESAWKGAKLWSAASSRRFHTSRSDDEHGKPSPVAALSCAKSNTLLCCDNGATKTTTATAQKKKKKKKKQHPGAPGQVKAARARRTTKGKPRPRHSPV